MVLEDKGVKKITNEKIAIVVLMVLLLGFFVAYVRLDAQYTTTINEYNQALQVLGIKNTNTIIPRINNYLTTVINSTEIKNTNISYIGITNGLYRYNLSINGSWEYIYTTLDGEYMFLPYKNPTTDRIQFDVIPLTTNYQTNTSNQ